MAKAGFLALVAVCCTLDPQSRVRYLEAMAKAIYKSLADFRRKLSMKKDIVVLCGAGVSMIPPTKLPSGDQLRDLCVEHLVADDMSRNIVRRLLNTPAYCALLPEAVLQLIGSTVGATLDRFVSKIIQVAAPNAVHHALAKKYHRLFTTNFDLCLEAVGAKHVLHLHGSVTNPDSLQNQLYRIGKSSLSELQQFVTAVCGQTLLIVGYSLRDNDIISLLRQSTPRAVLYLSFDDIPPSSLADLPWRTEIAKGSVQDLLQIHSSLTALQRRSPKAVPSFGRKPTVMQRANALLRLCSRAGLYEVQLTTLNKYLPFLKGRAKLLAMCEVADSLRIARRYDDAEKLCYRVLKDRAARRHESKDAISTVLVQIGLIRLDQGDSDFDRIESVFRRALEVFEELVRTEPSGRYEAENDIWRARIFNNLGLVSTAKRDYDTGIKLYRQSIMLKRKHHERYGIAQTCGNIAKTQILAGRLSSALQSLSKVVTQMGHIPDPYVCDNVVTGCLKALVENKRIRILDVTTMVTTKRNEAWWRRLKTQKRGPEVDKIIGKLHELQIIYETLIS